MPSIVSVFSLEFAVPDSSELKEFLQSVKEWLPVLVKSQSDLEHERVDAKLDGAVSVEVAG
jgi:hypothetical protein